MATAVKLVREYFDHIRGLAAKSPVVQNATEIKINIGNKRSPTSAVIRTADQRPLTFTDGATLIFTEKVTINELTNRIEHTGYSYHYMSGDKKLYFRYERDVAASLDKKGQYLYNHAENHLHANSEFPRYMTHATNFEEVFRFITACFY